ncbi:hypothetical protein MAR_012276 [Mya arenaria]|uniref:Caspase recruitment domain-containing protein n=1 Tax=Mya arenaria TaxID=6604 RepID=A0ABY7FWL4_MYAAR|nr:hypothetical protein MAR_012276 [Mya arenaria]
MDCGGSKSSAWLTATDRLDPEALRRSYRINNVTPERNKRENSFRRKDVLLSKENLYWDDMHKREYRDSEFSCNHVNPTVEDEDTVWKVRGCQGESSQYLEPLCQAMIMKETVICGPEIKVRPLPPLPQATPTSSIYNYVEYPQKYRNIADRSKRDAMILLVNEIEKSEELGRWKQFVEALERCGYEYISRCLKGHSVIDNSYQKKFLEIMSVTVRKQIVPTELTAYLWNADVINDEDKQRIECQQTLQGEIAAADLLLEILPTKNDNWYKLFIDALRHAEMIDVANLLDLPELREGKKVKTIPDSDNTVFKSTSLDDVNEQNTNMNYQNKDSSNMDTMENETCTWSSWSSTKSVPEIPFFVVALHSRPKKREMELSISEGDCLKVVEDYGDFYGVQVEGRTWLIPRDSAKVFDKVPIPLPRECAESADETYSPPPPLPERNSPSIPERNSPSLPERTPVDAFKINDTTEAATYSDDKRYEEVESHHLRAKVFDTVPTPLPGEWAESADETYKVPPPLRERAPVDALKLNDTTVAATDCIDKRYEEVESPDLRDSSTLDDVIDADWKTLKEEQDRLFKAERLVKEELERLKALVNIKNNINELQCQKLKVAKDFASAGERFKLHRESIKGVQGGNFDHFEPESEYSSEGLYSAQHMLRNRTEKTSRDLPLQFEMYRARSTGRKSWRSRASSFKDSAIYECTNLAAVEEDT